MKDNNHLLLSEELGEDLKNFEAFLETHLGPNLSRWYREGAVPRSFFQEMARNEWLGFDSEGRHFVKQPSIRQAVLVEGLSKRSPGVAVAFGAHVSLGTNGLILFGAERQKKTYLDSALRGNTLMCLGNTELTAGSDVANVPAKPAR